MRSVWCFFGFLFLFVCFKILVWPLLCAVGDWNLYGVINCNSKTYICLLVMSYYCCYMLRSVLILCCVNVFGWLVGGLLLGYVSYCL